MGMLTHRHRLYELVPRWLRGFNAFTVLYAIAVVADALGDALFAAMKIRFPNVHSEESLPLLASERRMVRGRSESAESFAARLDQWWDVAKHSGDLFTIAKEVSKYFLPAHVSVQVVTNNGTLYTLSDDGGWHVGSCSWNWDNQPQYWSRFWLLISNTVIEATDTEELVNSGQWVLDRNRFVGSAATDTAADVRLIEETHRAPHNHCAGILVLLDVDAFWASPPDGSWNYWANRNPNALYWAGTL